MIISLPFLWQEHEEPYDFVRFTSFGIIELLESNGFEIESIVKDTGAIEAIVDQVLSENPSAVEDFKTGKGNVLGFLIGQVMKASKGQANPGMVNEIMRKKLS